jgi:hypothetical protein
MEFIKPVFKEKCYIRKDILRFGKLKCKVSMKNEAGLLFVPEKLQE